MLYSNLKIFIKKSFIASKSIDHSPGRATTSPQTIRTIPPTKVTKHPHLKIDEPLLETLMRYLILNTVMHNIKQKPRKIS